MRINIKASGPDEKRLLNYFEEMASDMLVEKINSGKKTFAGCWDYVRGEARKRASGGCAFVEDAVVYGWATHYFEEDDIKEKSGGKDPKATKTEKSECNATPERGSEAPSVTESAPEEKKDGFIDLSDFM